MGKLWDDCYRAGFGNLRYPDEAIAQTIHHLGLRGWALDVGCGSGRHVRMLDEMGFTVWGIDGSPEAVELAKPSMASPDVVAVTESEFPPILFGDGEFDLVLCANVLEHNMAPTREGIVGEIHRVLKPGGTLVSRESRYNGNPPDGAGEIVEDFTWERKGDTILHLFQQAELAELMTRGGFPREGVRMGFLEGWFPWIPWRGLSQFYAVVTKEELAFTVTANDSLSAYADVWQELEGIQ